MLFILRCCFYRVVSVCLAGNLIRPLTFRKNSILDTLVGSHFLFPRTWIEFQDILQARCCKANSKIPTVSLQSITLGELSVLSCMESSSCNPRVSGTNLKKNHLRSKTHVPYLRRGSMEKGTIPQNSFKGSVASLKHIALQLF